MAEAKTIGVLVVEDDLSIRRLLTTVLGREGFHVETASDGIEAVLKLGLCDYDVIVLDLMMPNLDGFAFIDNLREHDPGRLQRIIVTSAASPAIIRERLHGKPFAVVPKPFDLAELVAKIRDCATNGDR
ncbi:MAG: two-component system, OmpR family, response regulator [Acidobacteriota bacterium]|nr:two-component system, OmpR family, response regulator [Acidobacteriota bacterium]